MSDAAPSDTIVIVLTNLPDAPAAERLALALVTEGLVACANVLAPCTSLYRWQGQIERATEVPVLLKARGQVLEVLQRRIAELHPYEIPEIIAWSPQGVWPAYARWVCLETKPGGSAGSD